MEILLEPVEDFPHNCGRVYFPALFVDGQIVNREIFLVLEDGPAFNTPLLLIGVKKPALFTFLHALSLRKGELIDTYPTTIKCAKGFFNFISFFL
jgi:hypothetical protein